jgi:hypothetical protein
MLKFDTIFDSDEAIKQGLADEKLISLSTLYNLSEIK